jgi:membrane-associated phospholipid phosphatase
MLNPILPPAVRAWPLLLLLLVICIVTGGCASVPHGSVGLGQRIKYAAVKGVSDPLTWGSALGASLMPIADMDYRLSDWAKTKTPIFGGQAKALDASDRLRRFADYGSMASLVAAPAGTANWIAASTEGLVDAALSHTLTLNTTGVSKREVGRRRPHRLGNDSFPSAHSSTAFNYAAVGREVVPTLGLNSLAQTGLSATFNTLAIATAWARVEGGVHYPSDVLFGAAVGNFFGIFVYELMLGPDKAFQLTLSPTGGDGYSLQVGWPY